MLFLGFFLTMAAMALTDISTTEQEYLNRLEYRRSRLEIIIKKRLVDEKRSYSQTDTSSTTYSLEAYSQTYGTSATSNLQRSEAREIEDWYIYKGGISELSDLDFLNLIGDKEKARQIKRLEWEKAGLRDIGTIALVAGMGGMLVGAMIDGGNRTVIGIGAVTSLFGFFLNIFNAPPAHYIKPDYAQEQIDLYNFQLKKALQLPLETD